MMQGYSVLTDIGNPTKDGINIVFLVRENNEKNSHRKSGILGLSYMKITENKVQIKFENVYHRKPQNS